MLAVRAQPTSVAGRTFFRTMNWLCAQEKQSGTRSSLLKVFGRILVWKYTVFDGIRSVVEELAAKPRKIFFVPPTRS